MHLRSTWSSGAGEVATPSDGDTPEQSCSSPCDTWPPLERNRERESCREVEKRERERERCKELDRVMEKEPKERRTEMLRDGEKDKTEKEMERGAMWKTGM